MIKKISFSVLLFIISLSVSAQTSKFLFLDWEIQDEILLVNTSKSLKIDFSFKLAHASSFDLTLKNPIYIPCTKQEQDYLSNYLIDSEPIISSKQGIESKNLIIQGTILPLRKVGDRIEKLVHVELVVEPIFEARSSQSSVENSVLSSGNWYKISVTKNGLHKITYQDFVSQNIAVNNINPEHIKLFGRPGGLLPYTNEQSPVDDLEELAIRVVGYEDGSFDESDYVLFYGQGPNQWKQSGSNPTEFQNFLHHYSDKTYYFLTIGNNEGKRVTTKSVVENPNEVVNTFNDFAVHHSEETNFVKSGRTWYGDPFGVVSNRTFAFNFPNLIGDVTLKLLFAGSSSAPHVNNIEIAATGMETSSISISYVSGDFTFAKLKTFKNTFSPNSNAIQLNLNHSSTSVSSQAWIDKIEINAVRSLKMVDSQMSFRSLESVGEGFVSEFQISNASSVDEVWDVTDPLDAQNIQENTNGSIFKFVSKTDTLKEFVAFDAQSSFFSIGLEGQVVNQNLHALNGLDFVIISHPDFMQQANRLADFRREKDGLTVAVVTPQQIYNEFSSGAQDVSAIRDFAKMLYHKDYPFKYLLLFGDASYDPKNRILENTNYIVSYQSENSHSSISSYATDDFFALLDEGESITSNDVNLDFLDIGVGRFPVQTLAESKVVVDKLINYASQSSYGDWRLNMCFVGDDNDVVETVHTSQAEELADYVSENYIQMNIDKIYVDAYEQETSTGGQRCPDVNNAINKAMAKGMFVVNYTGHGGELGWAHERILELNDINSWKNKDKLPLFMTATCEFSRYDDPERVSAGEQVFLKEDGGAIALLTTSRVVFTGSNMDINESFLQNLFPKDTDVDFPRLGDVLRRTKNNVVNISSTNHRNFTLLGDPSLQLAYPKHQVVLTEVQDSAKALGTITISGEIHSNGVKKENFNGYVFPSVFDKSNEYQTLSQDQSPLLIFDLQKNLLFKGKASVKNGEFSFTFVVPRDINYSFGKGKISIYAMGSDSGGSVVDASGYNLDLVVGGTDNEHLEDFEGPEISLFMNDTTFINGSLTNEDPILFAKVFDENGINIVSNGIGHNISAVIDDQSSDMIILNDFYDSEIDSYQNGIINYPFSSLSSGKHTLKVKVWDVYNNSSESELNFVVAKSSELSIQNLMNYPNPMSDYTSFYFDHNQANGEELDVTLHIIDLQGRIVQTINEKMIPQGFKYGPISWQGSSSTGASVKNGVFLYRLVAKTANGNILESSGQLILLK